MSRQAHLQTEYVEFIPEQLEPGKLYISRRYSTAAHLCCCGCGLEVITPLNPARWRLTEHNGKVSLYPSIGNWSFPCRSHYWITEGRIQWAGAMSAQAIAAVKRRDQEDAEIYAEAKPGFSGIRQSIHDFVTRAIKQLRLWLRL